MGNERLCNGSNVTKFGMNFMFPNLKKSVYFSIVSIHKQEC